MIKIAIKNSKFLERISEVPLIGLFFVLKTSGDFNHIKNEKVIDKFFKDIHVDSSTSKKTNKNRFSDIDQKLIDILDKNVKYHIHDIAVSSGVTSLDLYEKLKQSGFNFKLNISDKYAKVFYKKRFITRAFDEWDNLFFAYVGPFFAVKGNKFFPLSSLLYFFVNLLPNNKEYQKEGVLFLPEVIEKIYNSNINYIDYDLFETGIQDEYDVVRVMNVLNKSYFDEKTLEKGLVNICGSLKEKGILIVGRTTSSGVNHVSFYKKEGNTYRLLAKINDGTEIDSFVHKLS